MNLDFSTDNEMSVDEAVNKFYEWCVENDDLIWETITEEDFNFMKDKLNFQETYEEYQRDLAERKKTRARKQNKVFDNLLKSSPNLGNLCT